MSRAHQAKQCIAVTPEPEARSRTGTALLLAIAACWLSASACGGATPKQAGESETPASAHATESSSDMTSEPTSEAAGESTKPSAETSAAAPSDTEPAPETPCKFDTSQPITDSSMGTIRITGCISPSSVVESIKFKWRSVFDCYQDARKADPKAKGAVEIRIGVGKKGVRSVQVPRSEIPSDEFIQCVIDTLRDAPMPKPEQDTAMIVWSAKF